MLNHTTPDLSSGWFLEQEDDMEELDSSLVQSFWDEPKPSKMEIVVLDDILNERDKATVERLLKAYGNL